MAKKIEAIIREEKLNDVKNALREIGIVGLNVFEVRGHGRQGGIELAGRTGSYHIDMLTKFQINIVLSDHNVDKTIDTICKAARTGQTGDGLIFVYPVEDVIRIRTGERGSEALTYEGDIDSRRAVAEPVKVAANANGNPVKKKV
jgi:nitrogen regulatory protein P-II 1